jgi:hypothetical protein
VLLVVVVGWARVKISAHTLAQALAGVAVGAATAVPVWLWLAA